jgi:hypothetical protein
MKSLKNNLIKTFGDKKKRKRKSAKKNTKSAKNYTKKKVAAVGGRRVRTKFPNCSQTMVSFPLGDCMKKNCTGSKKYKADMKKLTQLRTKDKGNVAKKCNIDVDKYGELWPEGEEQYDCLGKERESPLFQNILKLEKETSKRACEEKYCGDLDYFSDCVDLGEEKCRLKYKDLIESQEKKRKIKMESLERCSRDD